MKRVLYVVPIFITVLSVFGVVPFSAAAEETSGTIGDSVTDIGKLAFMNCTLLENITIPDSVTSIGEKAFGYIIVFPETEPSKVDGFTIYGYEGSAAERYAEDNGFAFVNLENAQEYLLGDIDGDGEVSVLDATYIQKYIALLPVPEYELAAADTEGDGEISVLDATLIQKWIAMLLTDSDIDTIIS